MTGPEAAARRRALHLGAGAVAGLVVAGAVLALLLLPSSVHERNAPSSRPAAIALAELIGDVRAARGRHFSARDSAGRPLDTLKVVAAGPPRSYVAVYHSFVAGHYSVRLATSSDLEHFVFARTLATDASQPSIAPTADGGFITGWEKRDPGNRSHLQFASFGSLADLLDGQPDRTIDVSRTLSRRSEGTPSFVTEPSPAGPVIADSSAVTVGFHYYDAAARADRNGRGQLNVDTARTAVQPAADINVALARVARGNLGDRDELRYRGLPFTVIEAQTRSGDFGSWRIYLYDESTHRVRAVPVRTPAGSTAFGNPAVTVLTDPAGKRALFVSVYVFTQGARGREAGPLIYHVEF